MSETTQVDIDGYASVTVRELSKLEMTLAYQWSEGDEGAQKVTMLMAGLDADPSLGVMGKPELLKEFLAHPHIVEPIFEAVLYFSEPWKTSKGLGGAA